MENYKNLETAKGKNFELFNHLIFLGERREGCSCNFCTSALPEDLKNQNFIFDVTEVTNIKYYVDALKKIQELRKDKSNENFWAEHYDDWNLVIEARSLLDDFVRVEKTAKYLNSSICYINQEYKEELETLISFFIKKE